MPSRGVRLEQVTAGNVAGEWLIPRGASRQVIYYLHGGGFVMGSPGTHRPMVQRIAQAAGARALQIDYRLAPEHPFPAALEDSLAGYRWLLAHGVRPSEIVIAGDSAGGNLTLATLLALRDGGEPFPAGAVCLSPVTDHTRDGESHQSRGAEEALISGSFCRAVSQMYLGDQDPRTPLASPLFADLRGLPPILLHVGTHELLLDDSREFAAKAKAAGVEVTLRVWDGLWHVFPSFVSLPESRQLFQETGAFVRQRFTLLA